MEYHFEKKNKRESMQLHFQTRQVQKISATNRIYKQKHQTKKEKIIIKTHKRTIGKHVQDLIGPTIKQRNTTVQGFVYFLAYAYVRWKYIKHPCRAWNLYKFVENVVPYFSSGTMQCCFSIVVILVTLLLQNIQNVFFWHIVT